MSRMTAPVINIIAAPFEEMISDDKLLQRALIDCISAVGVYAVVGRTTPDAIMMLHGLREILVKAKRI